MPIRDIVWHNCIFTNKWGNNKKVNINLKPIMANDIFFTEWIRPVKKYLRVSEAARRDGFGTTRAVLPCSERINRIISEKRLLRENSLRNHHGERVKKFIFADGKVSDGLFGAELYDVFKRTKLLHFNSVTWWMLTALSCFRKLVRWKRRHLRAN